MHTRDHWLFGSLSPRRYLVGLIIFYLLFAGTLISSQHRLGHNSGDFNQLIQDGAQALKTRQLGAPLPLEYPPTARPLFILMSLGPPHLALAIWWLIHAAMYWQSAVWLSRRMATKLTGWRTILPAFGLAGLCAVGLVSDLSVGQLTGLVLFCTVGSFELDDRKKPVLAGTLLAIALLVKPLPAVLLVYFVLRRRWAVLAATAAAYLALGPLLLAVFFGWNESLTGWTWFLETTARERSPLHVFQRWADMPGYCLTYRESGLASSLIRLFMDVTYDNQRNQVQIAQLSPETVRAIFFTLIGVPLLWTMRHAIRKTNPLGTFHIFGAIVGLMLLANPKFISYWLALSMGAVAPLCQHMQREREAGRWDVCTLGLLCIWLASTLTLGIDVFRAAGSVAIGAYALTIANLIGVSREGKSDSPSGSRHIARD